MASIQETLGAGRKGYATLIAADPPRRGVIRRIVLPTALATVLLGFAAIVWLAWQDSLSGSGEPPLIRAAAGPIKRPPDTPGGVDIEGERLGVTSLLAGPPPQPRVERLLPREPTPPKSLAEAEPTLLAPPAPEPRAVPAPATPVVASPPEPARPAEPSRTAEPVRPMPVPPAAAPHPTAPNPAAPPGSLAAARPSPALAPTAAGPSAAPAMPPPVPAPAAAAPAPAPVASPPPVAATAPAPPPGPTASPSPARPAAPPPEQLAAREPPSAPAVGSRGRGPWGVQIAAVSSREAAERGWAQLQGRHPEVLGGLQLRVDEAKLANGLTLYRLQGLGFADRESAAQACARLKAAGTECFVVGGR